MSVPTKPLEVINFTGGITDYFIDGQATQGEAMDNLVLNPNKKLVTRWGSELLIEEQLPLGVFRVNKALFYEDTPIAFQQKRAFFSDGSWNEILGPSGGTFFPDGDANSIISDSEWRGHAILGNDAYSSPQKLYRDDVGDLQVRNAGLPEVPSGTNITLAGAGSFYLYAFVLKYSYNVETVQFLDRGPVLYYGTVEGNTINGGNTASITLPTSLTTVENWDEVNIEVEIYRTIDAGDVYYLIDTVTLGTTPVIDDNEDADIQSNEQLYTTGGLSSNGTPPKAKFVHVVNDIGYYANILDGTEEKATEVRQSIIGDFDSVPASYFAETEQNIKGLYSIYDRPVVLCEKFIYRIDNVILDNGTGDMDLRRIDDKAGCVSQNSIVATHKGLFWAGDDGLYWSDGFKVQKISDNINETYKLLVSNEERKQRIYGAYLPSEDRVMWAVCKDDGANEPDMMIVLDLKWGIREESTFTTFSGGDEFRPTALATNNQKWFRGDTRGYILEHADAYFTDPKIDPLVVPADWEVKTIIHTYKSCFVDFGSKFLRKLVPRILVSAANTTNLALGISSSNDNNRVTGDLVPINYVNNITWGDTFPLWGDSEARWNFQGIIEEWRRFPAGGLRCQYKQVSFTNAEVQIFTSDLIGEATVDAATKTAVLGGSFQWPPGVVDYFISFENDNYTERFLITARTPTTITYADPTNLTVNGTQKFSVYGKPKGQVLELNGYVLHWAYLSKSHTPFSSGSLGSNP